MFWPHLGPHRSCTLSLLDPYCSQEKAKACLYRQTAKLKGQPLHAYPCSFHSQCCVGMAQSKPPGSRVGERWIGLIYAPREEQANLMILRIVNIMELCFEKRERCCENASNVAKYCSIDNKFGNCCQTSILCCPVCKILQRY